MRTVLKNARVVNEGTITETDLLILNDRIERIEPKISQKSQTDKVFDLDGKFLFPGIIDDQVHFREPGLTHKADILSESRAAVAGGITSFIEQPNTNPPAVTQELLAEKYALGAKNSMANYGFMMGTSLTNLDEILKTDPRTVPGVKVFMGSSTGNMLVDDPKVLTELFSKCKMLIVAHCEDEATIKANLERYKNEYGDDIPVAFHPLIRSAEACYLSSSYAVKLAKKYGTRLHVFHVSTARETKLFSKGADVSKKQITSEVCLHHLWFSDEDYEKKGTLIKWNPAVKTAEDREGLWKALLDDRLDVVATDHAPHTLEEKNNPYTSAPSGGPLVQHHLPAMLEFYHQGKISLPKLVEKMCHNPAKIFRIEERGFIREGYKADLTVVDMYSPWTVNKSNILYKCGWSPFEGSSFRSRVIQTFVNGHLVYNKGKFEEDYRGERLSYAVQSK